MTRVTTRTLIFYILAAISLGLLVLSANDRLTPVEGLLGRVARPFLLVFNNTGRSISEAASAARNLSTLRSQNDALKSRVDTLTIDNLRVKELEGENERLRELLKFKQLNPGYDFRGGQVIARVISAGPSNYRRTIGIDLGAQQGIERGMPVVTEAGLVGRIDKVYPDSSTVLLLTDASSAVDAMLQRSTSRVVGVVQGIAGGQPVMDYITQDADVSVGDLIITSGLGSAFPKGLVVGQVESVRRKDYEMYQQAVVRPTVKFDQLEIVLVITNFKPKPGQPEELTPVG
jgi:rod shape-determining protein MreC